MSNKTTEIIIKDIVNRNANTATIVNGTASMKNTGNDNKAADISRSLAGMSALAALLDNSVSLDTSLAGKASAVTGLAASEAAIISDLQAHGVAKDSTLIGAIGSVASAGLLIAGSVPTAIFFGVSAIGLTLYSLIVNPDDESITAMLSDLIESVINVHDSISDQVLSDDYVRFLASMNIPYGDSTLGVPHRYKPVLPPIQVSSEVNNNFNDAYGFIPRIDPLAIDLNGDGVRTISIDSGVLFDFNDDQMRTGTGWLDANDGFLVYDRNGNGVIDNGGELFGVDTRKTDGSLAKDGFDALRDLDSNGDGIFNVKDTKFGNVRIWQDKNSDGISQTDELKTLDELGITAINLDSQETNIDSNGNRIAATGTVEFADGATSTAANLDLSSNPFYREFTDTVEISEEIAALPDMQGSGAVRDLREAASQSAELAQLLEQYAGLKTYAEQRALLADFVSAWAKSSGYTNLFDRLENLSSGKEGEPKAAFMHSWLMQLREPNASELAQQSLLEKIAILEAFNGRDFYNFTLQENGSLRISAGSNVSSTVKPPAGKDVIITEKHLVINQAQAALLDKTYQTLLDSVYGALLPQTRLKPYLDALSLKWDGAANITLDYSAIMQQLNTTSQSNAVEAVLLGFELKDILADSAFDQLFRAERPKWVASLDSEQLTELNQHLRSPWFSNKNNESIYIGTDENNSFKEYSSKSSEFYGGAGDDILSTGKYSENNILVGGTGNDTLYGGYGADTYLFNLGDGQDQIVELGGRDALRFGEGIRPEDIKIQRDGNDFLFIHNNGTDQVRIKDIFNGEYIHSDKIVEQVTFTDGTVWYWDQLVSQGMILQATADGSTLHGLQGDDVIYGNAGDDILYGHEGNDVIYGGEGDDTIYGGTGSNQLYGGSGDDILRVDADSNDNLLVGGKGNDTLYGSYGDDVYLFNLGDGQDKIIELGGRDTLRFGEGIRPEDISMRHEGDDFLFIHANGNDQVRIKDVFYRAIEQITFVDGTIWYWDQIKQQSIISYVSDIGEKFNGWDGNDIIHGSAADDVIYGNGGNDIIYGGDGNDILDGGLGTNQLYGGSGDDILRVASHSEDNVFVGGAGDDSLYGSANTDTYIFNLGDGKDQIFEQGSYYNSAIDTLSFGEGIRPEDIKIQRDGNDFLFIHSNGIDQVRIKNIFDRNWVYSDKVVERVTFTDGTVWQWSELISQGTILHATDDGSTLNGLQGNDIIYGNVGDDILYGHEGDDVIYGGDGNDIIDGGEGSNQLYGGNGDDVLLVDYYSENNLLVGGKGNDIFYGSRHSDTYVFNLGDGKDQIFEIKDDYYSKAMDTLVFGEGIRPEDISMRREGDDFLFIHHNGSDQVLIKDVFATTDTSHYSELYNGWIYSGKMVEQVAFADDTVWDWNKLKQNAIVSHVDINVNYLDGIWEGNNIMYGSDGNDYIYGRGGDDIIYGGKGHDYISGGTGSNQLYGGAGDDLLIVDFQSEDNILAGGTGDDTLYGSFYADTYLFNRGDGQDVIVEHGFVEEESNFSEIDLSGDYYADLPVDSYFDTSNDKAIDKLVFGEGITAEDLWFEQQDHDLIVKIIGTDDQVLIAGWYEGKGYKIEEFHTADGRILLEAEVNKMVQAMAAFAPQAGGESNLTAIPREQLDSVIAVHWQ